MRIPAEVQAVCDAFGGSYAWRAMGARHQVRFPLLGQPAVLTITRAVVPSEVFESECRVVLALRALRPFGLFVRSRAEARKVFFSSNRRQRLTCAFGHPTCDERYTCRTTEVATASRVLAHPDLQGWLLHVASPDVAVEYHAPTAGEGTLALDIEPYRSASPPPLALCHTVGAVAFALRANGVVA